MTDPPGADPCKLAGVGCSFNPCRHAPEPPLSDSPQRARVLVITRRLRWALVILPLLCISCRESLSGFGFGLRARANAEQLFLALAHRHFPIVRTPPYDYARTQIIRGALSPARVFDDPAAWTTASGPVRLLEAFGASDGEKYLIDLRRGVGPPLEPADARHIFTLSRTADNQYRWETTVDFAIGQIPVQDVALVVSRLLTAADGLSERDARADVQRSAPRTKAAIGPIFSLDSLSPRALPDGSTALTLGIRLHSEQFRSRYAALGNYVRRYIDPARFRVVIADRAGVVFVDAHARDRLLVVKLRTQRGRLVPLAGAPRPIPDTLVATADFSVKVKLFTVGFHDLQMEFINRATDSERDWTVTARKEPKWNLPFVAARLLRTPLRHPFAGEGAMFRLGLRAGEGDRPTVLLRHARLNVHESAVLRFLNSLTNTAMGDFGIPVEQEKSAWLRDIFLAIREDARFALGP